MERPENNWTEHIRRKLDGFEVPADEKLWERIASDLPRRKKGMAVVWRAAAAAACAAILAGAYFLLSRPAQNPPAAADRPLLSEDTNDTASSTDGSSCPVAATTAPLFMTEADKTRLSEPRPCAAETEEAAETEATAMPFPQDTLPAERRPEESPAKKFMERQTGHSITASNAGRRTAAGNRRSGAKWYVAVAATNHFGGDNSASASGFSPLINTPFLGFSPSYMTASQDFPKNQTDEFGTVYRRLMANNTDRPTSTEETCSFPVSYALTFRYMITDRWGVNAGISYSSATSERRSGSDGDYYVTKQKMQFVGIPISVSYTFLSSRYLTLYALAGGSVEKCVSATKKDILISGGAESEAARKQNLGKRPWQGALNAGVGAQFNITRNYGVFVEPEVVCDLSDKEALPLKRRDDWGFQLSAGFRVSY